MNQVEKGKEFEERAARFLARQGVSLLCQNYRCRQGEVDLIGLHQNCLVFIEVKYRKNTQTGWPEEAVNVKKQEKICRTSDYFRLCHEAYAHRQVRYDVVAIMGETITWYQNAFPYRSGRTDVSW